MKPASAPPGLPSYLMPPGNSPPGSNGASGAPVAGADGRVVGGAPSAPLHGPLAASMERFAALAASALRAPFAFVALVGDDRRCFGAGRLPTWLSHDPGLLSRSGLLERLCAADGPVTFEDVL